MTLLLRTARSWIHVAALGLALPSCCASRPECCNQETRVFHRVEDDRAGLLRQRVASLKKGEGSALGRAEIEREIGLLAPSRREERSWSLDALCEYVEWAEDRTFADDPVVLSRELVARVLTLRRIPLRVATDLLARIADLDADDLTEYKMLPGETGAPPPRGRVPGLALWALATSEGNGESRLVKWVLSPAASPTDLWLAETDLRFPTGATAEERGEVTGSWLRLLPSLLGQKRAGLEGRILAELLVRRTALLDKQPIDSSRRVESRRLLTTILEKRGRFPATEGVPGARRDLLRAAEWSLRGLQGPPVEETRPLLASFREPLDPWNDFLSVLVPPLSDDAAVRSELAPRPAAVRATFVPDEQCIELSRLTRFTALADIDQQLQAAEAQLFDERGRLRNSDAAACLAPALVGWSGVAEAKRASLLAKILEAAKTPARFDETRAARRDGWSRAHWPDDPWFDALAILEERPGWVAAHPELAVAAASSMNLTVPDEAEQLVLRQIVPIHDGDGGASEAQRPYKPLIPRVWHAVLSLPDSASPTPAERRDLLRGWLTGLPAMLKIDEIGPFVAQPHRISSHGDAVVRIHLLAQHARRYDLLDEARKVLRNISVEGAAVPPEEVYQHRKRRLMRHAEVALAVLEDGEPDPR